MTVNPIIAQAEALSVMTLLTQAEAFALKERVTLRVTCDGEDGHKYAARFTSRFIGQPICGGWGDTLEEALKELMEKSERSIANQRKHIAKGFEDERKEGERAMRRLNRGGW